MNLPKGKLYTVTEAAEIIGVSSRTLRRWDKAGKVTIYRTPSGTRVFTEESIQALKRNLGFDSAPLAAPVIKYPTVIHSQSKVPHISLPILLGILALSIFANALFLTESAYPNKAVLGVQDVGSDLKAKVGEFLVWLLPEDFKNKATSLSSSEIIKVTGENISLGESFGGEVSVGGELLVVGQSSFSDLSVSGDLTVEGDTNLNTLTTNSITTSTLSVETSSFSGDLTLSSDTPKIVIKDTKTLSITDGTNTLLSLSDLGTTGTLEITQDINVKGVYKVGGGIGQTKTACGSSQYLGSLAVSGGIITSVGDCKDVSLTTGTDLTLSGDLEVGATSNLQGGATVNPASSSSVGLTVKGVSSQSEDLLQIKTSLDAVIARVDELGNIQGRTLESTVTTGTAPLTVASQTEVANLNSQYVSGNTASTLLSQPQPNLILNSDFSRRNKWMTFMPETFTDTSGYQQLDGGTAPTVASNTLTFGAAGNEIAWPKSGATFWRDARASLQFKLVSETNSFAVLKLSYVDDNNWVAAYWDPNGTLYLHKKVAGTDTNVASASSGAGTINNWYWLEIERQGTTYIVKVYNSGVNPVAKSATTLLATVSGTVSDSVFNSGGRVSFIRNTASTQVGGISSGDGGVYVEGWGPESWTPTYQGTKGGQSIGFDESTNSGPSGKQWAIRAYIPQSSNFRKVFLANDLHNGSVDTGGSYMLSGYIKTSGKVSSDNLVEIGTTSTSPETWLDDEGETTWTRKTSSALTFTTTAPSFYLNFNRSTSTSVGGTAFVQLIQLEQGSTVTPWRNAPADDTPIVWFRNLHGPAPTPSYSFAANAAWQEINPKQAAANIFVPWEATLEFTFSAGATNDTQVVELRPTIDGSGSQTVFNKIVGTSIEPIFILPSTGGDGNFDDLNHRVSAGKHRVAIEQKHTSGTLTLYSAVRATFQVRAIRGKFDLAEEYSIEDQSIEAGDVVRLSGLGGTTVEKVVGGYDQSVLGIISTAPGITLSSTVELNGYEEKPNLRPVALQGRVPVKVTSENGSIKRGDMLTSSNTIPGYAMKATKAGRSIGIAMEDFIPSSSTDIQTGKIMTFVNLSFYDPDVYLASTGELVINKAPLPQGDTLLTGEPKLQDSSYVLSNTTTKETIERIGAFNELFVANLKVGSLDASELRIEDYESKLSSLSARLDLLEGLYGGEPSLSSNSGVLSSLTVQEKTLLNDLGITGNITAGLLSIDGLSSSISSLTELKFRVPGGEVTIDTNGNLKIKKLSIDETGNSIGSVILTSGQTEVQVQTSALTPNSYVFATPDKPVALGITNNESTIFVTIKEALTEDLKIKWWVVN